MASCIICGHRAGFAPFKTMSGPLCKDCVSHIPQSAKKGIKASSASTIRSIIRYDKKNNPVFKKIFEETSSYGTLRLDERHGLFALCEETDEYGKIITECHDIFSALYLKDFAFSMQDKEANESYVKVSISFTAELTEPSIILKSMIRQATCYAKRVDDSHIMYSEPSNLTLFRSVMTQMIRSAYEKYDYEARKDLITPHAMELLKARSLFLLEPDYTEKELKKQRNRLIKVFHPDSGEKDVQKYAVKVNEYYRLLKQELER